MLAAPNANYSTNPGIDTKLYIALLEAQNFSFTQSFHLRLLERWPHRFLLHTLKCSVSARHSTAIRRCYPIRKSSPILPAFLLQTSSLSRVKTYLNTEAYFTKNRTHTLNFPPHPETGLIISHLTSPNSQAVLALHCWAPVFITLPKLYPKTWRESTPETNKQPMLQQQYITRYSGTGSSPAPTPAPLSKLSESLSLSLKVCSQQPSVIIYCCMFRHPATPGRHRCNMETSSQA